MSRVDCQKLDQSFMDYLYEELAAGEMGELRAHLEACARCSDEDNRFRSLRRKVAHLRIVEPPEAVSAQLMREARSVRSGSGSGSPWRKAAYYATPLVAMAAALAIWAHARVRYDGWAIDGSPSTPEYRAPAQVPLDDAKVAKKAPAAEGDEAAEKRRTMTLAEDTSVAKGRRPEHKSGVVSKQAGGPAHGYGESRDIGGGVAADNRSAAPPPALAKPAESAQKDAAEPSVRSDNTTAQLEAMSRPGERVSAGGEGSDRENISTRPDQLYQQLITTTSSNCARVMDLVRQLENVSWGSRHPEQMKNAYQLRANCQTDEALANQDQENARRMQLDADNNDKRAKARRTKAKSHTQTSE